MDERKERAEITIYAGVNRTRISNMLRTTESLLVQCVCHGASLRKQKLCKQINSVILLFYSLFEKLAFQRSSVVGGFQVVYATTGECRDSFMGIFGFLQRRYFDWL